MSTRSGKRIHSSFHENILKPVEELGYKSEKKTRSKRSKENLEDVSVTLLKLKKRENYVSFPTDDESVGDSAVINEPELKATRLRKNALKEQNITLPDIQGTLDSTKEPKKLVRITRRTKKFSENEDNSDTKNNEVATLEAVEKPKPKKNKKKKESFVQTTEQAAPVQARKSKRKKKKSSSNSLIVEEINQNAIKDNSINRSNMSIDSFHSAAGSPQRVNANEAITEEASNNTSDLESKFNTERKNIKTKSQKQNKNKPVKNETIGTDKATLSLDNTSKYETKLNKSDVLNSTVDKIDMDATSGSSNKNISSDKVKDTSLDNDTIPQRRQSKCSIKDNNISLSSNKDINTTFEKDTEFAFDKVDNKCSVQNGQFRKRRSSIKYSSFTSTQTEEITSHENDNQNTDLGSSRNRKRKSRLNDSNTSFKLEPTAISIPFEKDADIEQPKVNERKSLIQNTNLTFTTPTESVNTTFEKDNEVECAKTRKTKSSLKDTNLTFTPTITETINNTFEKDTKEESTNSRKRKSSIKDSNLTFTPTVTDTNNATFEKDNEVECAKTRKRKSSIKDSNLTFTPTVTDTNNATFEKDNEVESTSTRKRKYSVKDTNLTFTPTVTRSTTFEKDTKVESRKRKSSIKDTNLTFTPTTESINNTFEKDNDVESTKTRNRKSSVKDTNLTLTPTITKEINTTFDKSDNSVSIIKSLEKRNTSEISDKRKSVVNSESLNSTYDKSPVLKETTEKSDQNNTFNKSKELKDTTFDKDKKLDSTYDKSNSKSSIITSDSSNNGTIINDISHVSITSDESCEKIMNTTPLLIESSIEDSQLLDDTTKPESPAQQPQTPLKREGTFTKESPDVVENLSINKTPDKRMSLPSPGCTPYLSRSSNREKIILNVTRSIEKGTRSSLVDIAPRQTKVMFCSPVNNPGVVTQQKRKVIKSNLKGSNKSFVFDDSVSKPAARKRSYTLGDADDARVKRKRLADDMQHSVDRLSRPRTASASAKLEPSTPSKKLTTPSKSKPEAKVSRVKLPNFAALHQRQFDKMESLDECQERRAKRARQLLTPTGALTTLDRSSKGPSPDQQSQREAKNQDTPTKRFQTQLPAIDSIKPGYTRFGFKVNMDANPFSITTKNAQVKPKENKPNGLKREPTLPSLTGGTSLRREAAKQIVLREKSFTGKRNDKRNENRTVIKGIRTNRRFELQMRMRNMEQ